MEPGLPQGPAIFPHLSRGDKNHWGRVKADDLGTEGGELSLDLLGLTSMEFTPVDERVAFLHFKILGERLTSWRPWIESKTGLQLGTPQTWDFNTCSMTMTPGEV